MTATPVRSAILAAAACTAACAAPAGGPAPAPARPAAAGPTTYSPGNTQYRRASYLYVEQNVGGQTQRINEVLVYYLSATLARQGDRLTLSLKVDSVPRYETGGPSTGVADQARGVVFTGQVAPNGEVTGLSGGDSSNRLVQQMAEDVRTFYPRLPPTGVQPGNLWTDTSKTTSRSGRLPLTITAVSRHEADALADAGPDPVVPIRTLTTYSFAGTGAQGGQTYSVEGEGRRHTVSRLSASGRFLGAIATDTSSYTISLTGLAISIPGRQTRADTLASIP